jgi:hypothetical protein
MVGLLRMMWPALVGVLVVGCVAGEGKPETDPISRTHYGLVGNGADRTVLVIGAEPPQQHIHDILAGNAIDHWWMAIDIPRYSTEGAEIDLTAGRTFDLADSAEEVVFSQNFRSVCNGWDPGEAPLECWLVERYVSGDERLAGFVTVERTDGRLLVSHELRWEGTTDHFGDQIDGPPVYFGRSSDGYEVIASEFVVETPL